MTGRAIRGAFAGMVGVAAVAGTITTLRRWLLTSEQLAASRTHPEKIVQRIADQMDAGAVWGAILAAGSPRREIRVVREGLGLWTLGFNVLLPAMGAHSRTWTLKRRESVLTLSAHAAYGLAMAGTLRLLGESR